MWWHVDRTPPYETDDIIELREDDDVIVVTARRVFY
jgi:hypothetical protein